MAHRSSRHRVRPVKVMACMPRRRGPRAPRCADIHIGSESTPARDSIRKPDIRPQTDSDGPAEKSSTAGRSPYTCFERLAKSAGLNVRVESAGTDPDSDGRPAVAAHLKRQGYPAPKSNPRKVTAKDFESADVVISIGCDLSGLQGRRGKLVRWDEVRHSVKTLRALTKRSESASRTERK